MRILLLNDNPVVRKLVALSAQKTKDDLNVVSSVDEIEHDGYDLVIIDDAQYSNDLMVQLEEKITFKTSLLMATRGNTIEKGFDHIINKPFLPTDLVELFARIENTLSKAPNEEEKSFETLQSIDENDDFDTLELDSIVDLDVLSKHEKEIAEIEPLLTTSVLDHEEVEEVQDLLDDSDEDEFMMEHLEAQPMGNNDDLLDGLDDFEMEDDPILSSFGDLTQDESLDELDDLEMDELSLEEVSEDHLDDLNGVKEEGESLDAMLDEEEFDDLETESLSDDEFNDLELQIQKATGELGLDDLELELEDHEDDLELEDHHEDDLDIDSLDEINAMTDTDNEESLDGFEGIDEREMKLALGEEIEEDEEESIVSEKEELAPKVVEVQECKSPLVAEEKSEAPVQGVEALQALLKALSNDDVVKSLKGLNISININFGETK